MEVDLQKARLVDREARQVRHRVGGKDGVVFEDDVSEGAGGRGHGEGRGRMQQRFETQ